MFDHLKPLGNDLEPLEGSFQKVGFVTLVMLVIIKIEKKYLGDLERSWGLKNIFPQLHIHCMNDIYSFYL